MTNGSSWKSSLTRNAALRDKTPHQRFFSLTGISTTAFVKLGSRMHSWWVMKRYGEVFCCKGLMNFQQTLQNFTVKWISEDGNFLLAYHGCACLFLGIINLSEPNNKLPGNQGCFINKRNFISFFQNSWWQDRDQHAKYFIQKWSVQRYLGQRWLKFILTELHGYSIYFDIDCQRKM